MKDFTPGEWELERTETDESLLYARCERHTHLISPIARINHPDGSAEGMANAVLLRESKNLLEALKVAANYLWERDGDRAKCNPVRALMVETIAKAEGK